MSMSFSGLGSGLPTSEWITALIQAESTRLSNYYTEKSATQTSRTTLSTVESKFSSLRSSVEKLTDAHLASSFDLFDKRKASSTDEDVATASVSTNAAVQKIDLKVETLATSTTAQSLSAIGQVIDGSEKFVDLANGDAEVNMDDGDATDGTFSFYIDGIKHEFSINEDDTVNDIVDTINNAGISGLQAGIDSGNFEIKVDDAQISSFVMGSSGDSSNFLNVMNLSTATGEVIAEDPYDTVFRSTDTVSKVDTSQTILDGSANLSGTFGQSSYTFKIGGSEFTVDENMTMQDLISKINNDDEAGVIANFDFKDGTLNITAEDAGKTAINFEDTDGDFLVQMGLITAGGDSLSSQTLGNNAKVYINGAAESLEVNSNSITSDISGISGVTIDLKNVTETDETISINVEQDTDQLVSAVEDFVNKMNSVIKTVDTETSTGQELKGEYSLISLRNSLRMGVSDMVSGLSSYNSLGMIGISTGDIGTSIEEDTNAFEFDKDAFLEALQENPSEVKALLIGDNDLGVTGILQNLESKLESSLDPVNGYFAAREDSFDSQISTLDDTITREQERLDNREEYFTRKFNQMDQYISQMKQQQSSLMGLL